MLGELAMEAGSGFIGIAARHWPTPLGGDSLNSSSYVSVSRKVTIMFHRWTLSGFLAVICLTWLLGVVNAAEPIVTSRAYVGEPFGVGEVTIQFSDDVTPWDTDQLLRIVATDVERIYYPASTVTYVRSETQNRLLRVTFLFHGKQERRVRIHAVEPITATVTPVEDSYAHKQLLDQWWLLYWKAPLPSLDSGHSTQLRNYLRNMLSLRTGLQPVPNHDWSSRLERLQTQGFINQSLGLLTGATSIRAAMQNQRMLATSGRQEAISFRLTEALVPPPVPLPEKLQPDTAVEAIALHVPAECFYVRCQRLTDYLWLRDLVDAWGGTVDNLVAQESFDFGVRKSVERRLAITLDAQTRDLLDKSISDLAIIGTDLFFRDGPSVGVLLEAKDDRILADVIRRQRDAVRSEPGALEREIRLGDYTALLLTTSDGTVRSIYAVSGKYHLITTSSFIAQKFLACDQGEGSLGKLDEFRYARQKMPLSRNDQAFLYLSDPFFRLLVGPAYRVEMTRRAAALADLQLVEMARLAAAGEGKNLPTVALLRDAGLLPKEFGPRSDGAAAEIVNDRARDSLRGTAGGMLPIPDVEITGVTRSEDSSYETFEIEYRRLWQRLDPVTVAIARKPSGTPDREKVALDFIITPYVASHYRFLSMILMPNPQRLSVEDELVVAMLECSLYLGSTAFVGFKGQTQPFRVERGDIVFEEPKPDANKPHRNDQVKVSPFFFGDVVVRDPSQHVTLRLLGGAPENYKSQPDQDGYVEAIDPDAVLGPFGSFPWCRLQKGMTTYGRSREDLEKLTPGLKLVAADRPAQIRLRFKDLQGTPLGRLIDSSGYLEARQLSAANAHLLWQFDQQLQVPPEKIAEAAVRVIGGRPLCPLGGEYTLGDGKAAPALWSSSEWQSDSLSKVDRVPENYRFPFTAWMRELDIDFLIDATTLSTHVEVTWQR